MDYLKASKKILINYYENVEQNLKLILQTELRKQIHENTSKITNIVYGVVRKEKVLDYIISQVSNTKIKKIMINNLILLRIGLFIIFFADSTPNYAIVNEIVKLTKNKTKKFINAILRTSIRKKTKIIEDTNKLKLEIKYSISKELIHNLKFLSEDIEPFLKYLNKKPIFHLLENTFNTEKNSNKRQKMLKHLKLISPLKTYELEKPKAFISTLIKDGSCYIQNTGSQIISIISAHFSRNRVLDCCAAPGTKSITLKNLRPNLKIIANDIHFDRINLLKKTNITDIDIMVSDISVPSCKNVFDLLIVDAPCSSSGTLRKNPDLKTKITETFINNNVEKQKHILQSIFENFSNIYVLYAVCSFIKNETEDILDYIITKNKSKCSIKIIELSDILNKYQFEFQKGKHGYYLLPSNNLNNDMFYISLISLTPLDQI